MKPSPASGPIDDVSGPMAVPSNEPKYQVIAELGRGGMAMVYLALAHGAGGFSKLVVLKCIRPELTSEPQFFSMFMSEARLAACLNHPNIVQTNEVIDRPGGPIIVMEYLEGQTLSEILRRGRQTEKPMPVAMHLHILVEVLRGLHYAHEAKDLQGTPLNLVHRDVSPQNILVTYSGEVKILDFGIAKSAEASEETRTGVMKGKIRYMPPEQILAKGVDRRADVYAVGVLLWQALTGRDYWQGKSDLEVMQAVVTDELPSVQDAAADLPAEAEQVLGGALAAEIENRFESAAVLGQRVLELIKCFGARPQPQDIEHYLVDLFAKDRERAKALVAESIGRARDANFTGTGEIAFPSISGTRSLPVFATRTAVSQQEPAADSRPPRKRRSLWLLMVAVLALMAGGGARYYQRVRGFLRIQPEEAVSTTTTPPSRTPVAVRLSATPSEARLLLDGAPLPTNPYEQSLVPDGQRHTVRAELPGYMARQETFVLNAEVAVSMALEHETPQAAASGSTARRPVAPHTGLARPTGPHRTPGNQGGSAPPAGSAAPPPPADPSRNCDPPYYTDSDGIRRVYPGCS